jgi:CDP-diacylglycerol--glycerol-3-phosphate 3-phosphatidyltransferase
MQDSSFVGLPDFLASFLLIVAALAVASVYLIKVQIAGRPRFERIDLQGGSRLLGKGIMEMAYWAMLPVASAMVKLGVSANLITCSTAVFGAISGVILATGHFGFASAVGAIAAMLDSIDGMVARAGSVSSSGKVLDSTLDRYVEFFFLGGLIVHYSGRPVLQIVTLFAILGSFMVSYTSALSEIQRVAIPRGSMRRPERLFYLIFGAALTPLAHAPYPMIAALVLVSALSNISAVARLSIMIKRLNEKSVNAAGAKRTEPERGI